MGTLSSRSITFHSATPAPATGNRLNCRPFYGTIGSCVPGVSILRFRCRDQPHRFCGISMSLRVDCCSKIDSDDSNPGMVKDKSVSVVILARGSGKRMGASIPKQCLPLLSQPIALYSFYTFPKMSAVMEIVVISDPSYKYVFEDVEQNIQVGLKFALPGKETRFCLQWASALLYGLLDAQEIDWESELVCIHDSARPLVLHGDVEKVLKDEFRNGAAVLGVPVKATIKEVHGGSFVVETLDRKKLWEIQTPQSGFKLVNRYNLINSREGLEVTYDVSIVEHLKHPVYITEVSYTNIKVTTSDDLLLAERILNMGGTVPGAEKILNKDAKVLASRKLCDAVVYLSPGFCPSVHKYNKDNILD